MAGYERTHSPGDGQNDRFGEQAFDEVNAHAVHRLQCIVSFKGWPRPLLVRQPQGLTHIFAGRPLARHNQSSKALFQMTRAAGEKGKGA